MAATSCAVAEAITHMWLGMWKGVSASSFGAVMSDAGGVKAWQTYTHASNCSIMPLATLFRDIQMKYHPRVDLSLCRTDRFFYLDKIQSHMAHVNFLKF